MILHTYCDDVSSINNRKFEEWLPFIYQPDLHIKHTTDTAPSVSFVDLHVEFDDSGHSSTKVYNKREHFDFKIINFSFSCSNIKATFAYCVYISQFLGNSDLCNYSVFLERHCRLRYIFFTKVVRKYVYNYSILCSISSWTRRIFPTQFKIILKLVVWIYTTFTG